MNGTSLESSAASISFRRLRLSATRVQANGRGIENQDEVSFALSYGIRALPNLSFMPKVQYILSLDNANIPTVTSVSHTAVVPGLQMLLRPGPGSI